MRLLLSILLISLTGLALALPTDPQQAIHIVADSSVFDYKKRFNRYEGHVKIDQGSSHVVADRVETRSNAQHKMEEAIAYGTQKLAHYWTLPKEKDPEFHAHARIIHFFPLQSLVKLEGDVVVTQGENIFHGPIILYNTKDQIVTAPAMKNGHATIVIEPNQSKHEYYLH